MDTARRHQPIYLTSYDLLKTAAVVFMLVDHLGYYFFTDTLWLRAVGRWCVPIWFFLIGYARSRDLGLHLWLGAAVLVLSDAVIGFPVLPVNILVTILIIRLSIDPLMNLILNSKLFILVFLIITIFILFPTIIIFEYGMLGFLISVVGYLMRNKISININYIRTAFLLNLLFFISMQSFLFRFDLLNIGILTFGTIFVYACLYNFSFREYPAITEKIPAVLRSIIRYMGRNTLYIYIGHILLFSLIGLLLGLERYSLFNWTFT
ncbi:MAG: TraX family protein [Pseudomonadota bacterium]